MPHIVIIGASIAGQSVALNLRAFDHHTALTLITDEAYPLYDRRMLGQLLEGKISEERLLLCEESYLAQRNIAFLKERTVSSLNTVRRTLYFKDRGTLAYDYLVIASGTRPGTQDMPGARKPGVDVFYGLRDVQRLTRGVFADPLCIVGSNAAAFELARAFARRFKQEVKLISRTAFDHDSGSDGVEVLETRLEEIIGEGQVQAIRVSSGKVIGVGAVLFMEPASEIEYLKSSEILTRDGSVVVDEHGRTSVERVYACGAVSARRDLPVRVKSWDDCAREGRYLADVLLKELERECQKPS